jgi:hypothetical protein
MRNATQTMAMQLLTMRSGLQINNGLTSCENVYKQARSPHGGHMRFDHLTPDRIKTRHTLVARHLAWHASMSRRTFLRAGVGASVVGGALGLGLLRPVSALAAPGIGNVLPIPTTIEVFPGVEIHVSDIDPSGVWNFQGASGIAFIDTTVTRTNRKTGAQQVLPSSNHMNGHQGIYVGRDGHVRKITFAFV